MRPAAYARYSSDSQRAASLEDQLRNIRAFCMRQGWPEPTIYTDAAISGARADRPEYRRLLADASMQRFDVLLVDDLTRLSRDKDDTGKAIKRLTFAGVRIIGVSDGMDTSREGHELDTGIRAVIGEHYLRDLAKKTHRGLTGRALSGASAGGLPYGYRITGTGQRAIDEAQAAVVRHIYAEFVAGKTPRMIAGALNHDRVPSPRKSTWCMTAIYGDLRRGIGILANPIYIGRQIWNRSVWTKHPDTGRRIRRERPESEWIIAEHPELAIVDAETFAAAQARLRATRTRTATHREAHPRGGPGRAHKHLLSGLLRCAECGGAMTVVDAYRYGCATHKDRGDAVCASRLKVARSAAESSILAGIKQDLLSDAAFRQFERTIGAELKSAAPDLGALQASIAIAERERDNILAALRAGIITPSTRAELLATEQALEESKAALLAAKRYAPAQIIPRLREVWHRMVDTLESSIDTPTLRTALIALVGDRMLLRKDERGIFAEIPANAATEITVVAGAGFEPATFGL